MRHNYKPTPLEQLRIACSMPEKFSPGQIDWLISQFDLKMLTGALFDGSPEVRITATRRMTELALNGDCIALNLLSEKLSRAPKEDEALTIEALGNQVDGLLAKQALAALGRESKLKRDSFSKRREEYFRQIVRFSRTDLHIPAMKQLVRMMSQDETWGSAAARILTEFVDVSNPEVMKVFLAALGKFLCLVGGESLDVLKELVGTEYEKRVTNRLLKFSRAKPDQDDYPQNLPGALVQFLGAAQHDKVAKALLKLNKYFRKNYGKKTRFLRVSEQTGLTALKRLIGTTYEQQALDAAVSWLPSKGLDSCETAIRVLGCFADSSLSAEAADHTISIADSDRWRERYGTVDELGKFAPSDSGGKVWACLLRNLKKQGKERQDLDQQLKKSLVAYIKCRPTTSKIKKLTQMLRSPQATLNQCCIILSVFEQSWELMARPERLWKALSYRTKEGHCRHIAIPFLERYAETELAEQALERLAEIIADPEDDDTACAIRALGSFAEHPDLAPRAAEILTAAFANPHEFYRGTAIELAQAKFNELLTGLVQQPDPRTPAGVIVPDWVQKCANK